MTLLAKPGDTGAERRDGRRRYPDPGGPQAVAEEVEALLDAPDEGLVRVLLQSERREDTVEQRDGSPQFPPRSARRSNTIHLWNAYGRTQEPCAFKDFRGMIRWGFWNADEEVPGWAPPRGRLVGLYPSSSSSPFASRRSRVSKPSVNQA